MKVADYINIPTHIGRISHAELEAQGIIYTRNSENKELRDYAKAKFGIDDDFHTEEGDADYLIIVKNG